MTPADPTPKPAEGDPAAISSQKVAELLDSGMSIEDITGLARQVQYNKIVSAPPKAGVTLTDEQATAICDALLAPYIPSGNPPDISLYLAALGAALWAKDTALISNHILATLRAVIVLRRDLVALRVQE